MTQEEKTSFFRIALNICQFGFDDKQTDLMVRLYELVLEKQGETDLRSIFAVKEENQKAFNKENTKNEI